LIQPEELVAEAIKAREFAYAPYSKFLVGAALLTRDQKIFRGANIENASYSSTCCAERVAFYTAIFQGHRDFSSIAIAGWKEDSKKGFAYPCGACLQVMMEFCEGREFTVVVAESRTSFRSLKLEELLPHGFGPNQL
jgi:homotetrameric cytidine deaminase